MPLGLIVSELVANAAKYAFPDDRPGRIGIRLQADGDAAMLSVADDGVGLPPTADTLQTGLGVGMVRGLAQQIRGSLAVENDGGARLSLRFKPERPPS